MNESILIWIELAISDLKSSRILYNNECFRTSYFFFQQATEKANKAFALFGGLVDENELKHDIGHNQLKIYRRTLNKQKDEFESFIEVLNKYPEQIESEVISNNKIKNYNQSLKQTINVIDSFKNIDLTNISLSDLNSILNDLNYIKDLEINEIPQDAERIIKDKFMEVADWIGHFETPQSQKAKSELIELINSEQEFRLFLVLITTKLFPLIIKTSFMVVTFIFCAILTIQHSSLTRYPQDNISPDTIYNKELPIVKKQPDFMDLLEHAIRILEELNNNS